MTKENSYRQILRSSSIIGGATVINIFVGLLRTKAAAVLLGPVGVGLIGLMQSLMLTGSTIASLGFGNAGARQIAEADGNDDALAVATARRALFRGTLGLAAIGAVAFWLLRDFFAEKIFDDSSFAGIVGWLALGVALTVASGSQGALLVGLRRTGDVARVKVLAAILSATIGVTALSLWGQEGVLIFVLSAPLASFLLGHWFVLHLRRIRDRSIPFRQLYAQWKTLARLGTAFMVAGLAVTAGQLVVRIMVQRELGAELLGQFQAAWTIAMTYVGLVLGSMAVDYYPRLVVVIRNRASANRLVNEQTEVALLLAGPVFLAMLGLAPWIIELLYSDQFYEAVSVLRWQVLGDILKIASWPLGFVILAAGDGRTFILTESLGISVFVGLTWIGLPIVGINATGISFVCMYMVYLPTVFLLARRRMGFAWQRRVYTHLKLLLAIAVVVFMAGAWSNWLGAALGALTAAGLSLYGLARLGHVANIGGLVGRISSKCEKLMTRIGGWRE